LQEEKDDWERIRKENKLYEYERFILKYPSSEYLVAAQNRIKELDGLKIEVVMKHPATVSSYRGYYANGSSTSVWKWTISFSAKNNEGGFTLTSSSYTITNGGKTWNTGTGAGNTVSGYRTITVEKGKSFSYEQEFNDSETSNEIGFRGGVYERSWRGEDEYGNPITVKEKVLLK
jgi:hypothetical protein